MPELTGAILLLVLSGAGAMIFRTHLRPAQLAGQAGAIAGCVIGLTGAVRVLASGTPESLWAPSFMPGGTVHLQIDALSAFFLLPVFGLSIATAVYGGSYMQGRGEPRRAAASWFFLNLLTAGVAAVIVAYDGLLFLVAWEIMALSPFFLVIFDDHSAAVRHAAWTYFTATHIGTVFLVVMFVLLGELAGGSDFAFYGAVLQNNPALCSAVFVLALIGFGAKAGIVPAHIWLPEAHPVAPSHVSALMSGAMIKVGIYGLLRVLMLVGRPEPWWGWVLIAVGASSGLLGVLFALAQHDLKRLLAYSSVENIGIVFLGIGFGVFGAASGMPALAAIGFAAGLLHVLNHSICKGLLFLGAGAVQHAAHSLDFEELGGLLKRMKWTGMAFPIGAAGIVGLPPLNGFVSEFLLFYGGFIAAGDPAVGAASAGLIAIVVMGLISGLAAACFAKAFGIVFLGAPRTAAAETAHEAAAPMRVAMAGLALLCVGIGLAAPAAVSFVSNVLTGTTLLPSGTTAPQLAPIAASLTAVVSIFGVLIALSAAIWIWRVRLLARRGIRRGPVWGCGYLFPSAHMQYTASSLVQPLTTQFHLFIRNREAIEPPRGYFPLGASYASDSGDPWLRLLFAPTFRWFDRIVSRLTVIQHGHIHVYVLYVAATLLVLLVWASL